MPVFNLTIDDTSPLIVYNGWWSDSSDADSFKSDYVNSTFHATDVQSSSATLTFNGSAVYIYGAKRPNHDIYAVTLDQTTVTADGNSGSSTVNLFNQLLFSQDGLDLDKQHQVVLRNQYTTVDPSWVDVDYMIVTSGDGNEKTESNDTIWDDGNNSIVYSTGWESTPNNFSQFYYMETMHRTSTAGASASVIFHGNAVSVYGCTSTNHGLFSVSMDGQSPLTLNGTAPEGRYQMLLYYAGGLPDGQHNVTFTNLDTNGLWFDLDKVVFSKWPGAGGTSSSASATSSAHETGSTGSAIPQHKTAAGPIIGGAIAGIAGLALITAAVVFFLRRRSRYGIDRITRVRPGDGSKGDIFKDPEPFTIIEPFHASHSTQNVNERSPLSPGSGEHNAATTPFSSSFDASQSQVFSHSEYGAQSESSKYILPAQFEENPHRDFPPPDYVQATASASSRPPPPTTPSHKS